MEERKLYMGAIMVNKANALIHTQKIFNIANELTTSNFDVTNATRTTLSAMDNGIESFIDSQRLLTELAGLLKLSAATIETIAQNITNLDQQAATLFSGGGTI